jgi:hypothetical protein
MTIKEGQRKRRSRDRARAAEPAMPVSALKTTDANVPALIGTGLSAQETNTMLGIIVTLAALFGLIALGKMGLVGTPPYVPNRDADLLSWSQTFSDAITASPGTYGLTSGDASAIAAVQTSFADTYALGGGTYHMPVNAATKTPATTQAKNDAKTAMLLIVRPYAQQIANNAGVSSDDKIAIGLNPRTNTPTPVPTPTSFPIIGVRSLAPLTVTLQWQDSTIGSGKSKPYGCIQAEVRTQVSATAITDAAAIAFNSLQTKSPLKLEFSSDDGGKQLYYAMRWTTRTGLVGPWSALGNITIPKTA